MRYRSEVLAFAAGVLVVSFLGGIFLAGRASTGESLGAVRPIAAAATATPLPSPTPVPTATPIPGLACGDAQQAVRARHTTLFGLMDSQLAPAGFICTNRSTAGVVTVVYHWTYGGSNHAAGYTVSPSGLVTNADANAGRIDEAAKLGPLALKALLAAGG